MTTSMPFPGGLEDLGAYESRIRRLALSLLREDPAAADDLAQETLVSALGARARPHPEAAWVWLRTILIRHRGRHLGQRERQRGTLQPVAALEPTPSTAELVGRAEMRRAIVEEVFALGEPLGQVLALHHLEGWTTREIAAALERPRNTVKDQLRTGRKRLRGRLRRRLGLDERGMRSALACVAALPAGGVAIHSAARSVEGTLFWKAAGVLLVAAGVAGVFRAVNAGGPGSGAFPESVATAKSPEEPAPGRVAAPEPGPEPPDSRDGRAPARMASGALATADAEVGAASEPVATHEDLSRIDLVIRDFCRESARDESRFPADLREAMNDRDIAPPVDEPRAFEVLSRVLEDLVPTEAREDWIEPFLLFWAGSTRHRLPEDTVLRETLYLFSHALGSEEPSAGLPAELARRSEGFARDLASRDGGRDADEAIRSLRGTDDEARQYLVRHGDVAEWDDRVVDELIAIAASGRSPELREKAIDRLWPRLGGGTERSADLVPTLVELARDEPEVRLAVVRALAMVAPDRTLEVHRRDLISWATDAEVAVRRFAVKGLSAVRRAREKDGRPPIPEVDEALLLAVLDPDETVRDHAAR